MTIARDRLTAAALARVEAIRRRDEAQETLERASQFVASIEHELHGLRATESADTEASAGDIIAALKSGSEPVLVADRPAGASVLALRDCERRLAAARRAVDSLSAEHKQAESVLAAAEAEHALAVEAVLVDEAAVIAAEIERLEGEADRLRCRIGTTYGYIAQLRTARPDHLLRVIKKTDYVTNTPLWRMAQDAAVAWRAFSKKLTADPNATLTFGADASA